MTGDPKGYRALRQSLSIGTFTHTADAWEALASEVSRYLPLLEERGLTTHRAEWDMFRDDLLSRAAMPWEQTGLLDSPDGHLYGVERI